MLLSALLLAAALNAAPPSRQGDVLIQPLSPHRLRPYAECRARNLSVVKDSGERKPTAPRKKPRAQYAVIRTVDGCGVSTPMR